MVDLQRRQEADDGVPAAGVGAEAERDGQRSAGARHFGHFMQHRPALDRQGIELVARQGTQQQGREHEGRRSRRDPPGDAPRRAGQDDCRDQHHRAGARRHVDGPQRHGQALVGRPGDAQQQSRDRDHDGNEAQPFDEPPDQQGIDAAGEGAEPARGDRERRAQQHQPAMTEAIGGQGDRHAAQRRDQVHDRQQPAGLAEAGAELGADRRDRGRHLADMEGGHNAGRHQQPDQPPRRVRGAIRSGPRAATFSPATTSFHNMPIRTQPHRGARRRRASRRMGYTANAAHPSRRPTSCGSSG